MIFSNILSFILRKTAVQSHILHNAVDKDIASISFLNIPIDDIKEIKTPDSDNYEFVIEEELQKEFNI